MRNLTMMPTNEIQTLLTLIQGELFHDLDDYWYYRLEQAVKEQYPDMDPEQAITFHLLQSQHK